MKKLYFVESETKILDKDINNLYFTINKRIPNKFNVNHLSEDLSINININFLRIPSISRDSVKFWIECLIEGHQNAKTISTKASILSNIFYYLYLEFTIEDIEKIKELHYSTYLASLEKRVFENNIQLKTAYTYSTIFQEYLEFVESEKLGKFDFLPNYKLVDIFPFDKPQNFFKRDKLKEFLDVKEEKNSKLPISYSNLVNIMEEVNKCEDKLLRNITIILAHTGLRLTEVLNLPVDCLEPIDNKELKLLSKNKSLNLSNKKDWDNCYWLSNYKTIKSKQKKWKKGTPLLVSEKVKNSVDELIEYSSTWRGTSNMLCFNLYRNEGKVLSAAGYNSKKNKLIEDKNLPYFTAHQFRHTYAKLLYDKGIPLEFIRKYLNHIHDDITSGYIHRTKENNMAKYKDFTNIKTFVGGAKKCALTIQSDLKEAISHPEFQVMSFDNRIQLIELVLENSDIGINIMDHGVCFLPKLTQCPNNYTEVNSCMEEHCNKFVTTEISIPFLHDLIKYKKESILDLKINGFTNAVEYNENKLNKTINILEELIKNKDVK